MPKGKQHEDFAGREFGHLTLRERISKKYHGATRVFWRCECVCGKFVERRQDYLLKGGNFSCGCQHPVKLNVGKDSRQWSGCGDMSGFYFAQIRSGAQTRGIEFSLTIEEAWALFEGQTGCCALSGLPIGFVHGRQRDRRQEGTASLDRKNSRLGYTRENCQWLHKVVNAMKNHFDDDAFLTVCNAVAAHRPMRVDPTTLDLTRATYNLPRKGKALTTSASPS